MDLSMYCHKCSVNDTTIILELADRDLTLREIFDKYFEEWSILQEVLCPDCTYDLIYDNHGSHFSALRR